MILRYCKIYLNHIIFSNCLEFIIFVLIAYKCFYSCYKPTISINACLWSKLDFKFILLEALERDDLAFVVN